MKHYKLLAAMLLLVASAQLRAADQMQTLAIDQKMTVDALGNCTVAIDFSLTASQFQSWMQKYGQNKSLLKRDLGKVVSQYDTFDWNLQIKEMERAVTISLQAHGVVKHRGGGKYEFPVPKSWRGGDKNGTTLSYNFLEPLGPGSVAQYNCKVVLPEGTTDIKDDTGEAGERVVRYAVPIHSASSGRVTLYTGLGAGLLGICLVGASLGVKPKRPTA